MKCSHAHCSCSEVTIQEGGRSFCSEACKLAGEAGIGDETCQCGHDGCGMADPA